MNNALGVLGLAKKAGLLEIGDESVNIASKRGKAKLILSASDASDASKRHAKYYAENSGGEWAQLEFTKSELAEIIGRGAPGISAHRSLAAGASGAAGRTIAIPIRVASAGRCRSASSSAGV